MEDADRMTDWKHLVLAHLEGTEVIEPWLIQTETIDVEAGDSDGELVLMIREGLLVADLVADTVDEQKLARRFNCPSSALWIGVD